ncbi:MAG: integration host factor, actinobacterial type [Gaiellaceae bacterium]
MAPGRGSETPARSAAQRLEALRRANEIRIGRAQLKKDLATGSVRITDILATPPECAKTQTIDDLLLALPNYGPVRVARLLAHCRTSPSKTVAGLSERQRQELIGRLSS